ncbi:MAG: DUF167 domain-containing protein [Candidatus Paceibacterota bacterium]|jgi:uncharacterized protein YggU (UPF0235/DUF167 family)
MYIKVRVTPDSKKDTLTQKSTDHFNISVREPAENNRANRRVIEIIAEHFNITPKKIRIISGHHSPGKILDIPID